ncbi:flavin reductase [Maridesulfovibrio sp.]|uniref:flavin reductase n=1 Tax=Maridesulfovibrio sp. TaxID=2795000 RepID=UPI003BAD1129
MGISHTLLGGHVDGRPDYLPLIADPRINNKLSLAAIEIKKGSELHAQVLEEGKFSLNLFSGKILSCLNLLPSLSEKGGCTDCRCVSFYGNLGNVPLLEDAPLALECRIYEVIDLEDSSFVMAEITGSWVKGICFRSNCRPPAIETQPISLSDREGQGASISVIQM